MCSPFPDEVSPVQVKKEEEEVQEHVLSCCFCNFTNISMENLIEHYKTHVGECMSLKVVLGRHSGKVPAKFMQIL